MFDCTAYDTETTGLRVHAGAEMFAYSTCTPEGGTAIQRLDGPDLRQIRGLKKLKALWESSSIKIMHNAKFDLAFTEKALGQEVRWGIFHDTMIMSHILKNDQPSHGLKELCWILAGIPDDDEKAIKPYTRDGYQHVPESLMNQYQDRDAERTMLLYAFFQPKISEYQEIYDNEISMVRVTMGMEQRGIMLHRQKAEDLIKRLKVDCEKVADALESEVGRRVNPNKPNDIRWILHGFLRLPILRTTPKTGEPSTKKDVLAELREKHPHPVLDLILKYRSWSHGQSTIRGYLREADEEGIIHPDIMTNGAKTTGRQSCKNPNLQNVEKSEALLNPFPVPARKVFRPRPGFVHFHLDYSGIELRLMIHYTKNQEMIDAICAGRDLHAEAAAIMYSEWEGATPERRITLRTAMKNGNFAYGYGAKLARILLTLGIEQTDDVMRRFEAYRVKFGALEDMAQRVAGEAKYTSVVYTAFGRKLHVPSNKAYVATNFLIQGTAAGVLKRGQVRVDKYLRRATNNEVRLLLSIHDEIIIEFPVCRLSEAKHVLGKVREVMIDFPIFDVPLDVGVEIARVDWAGKEEFKL